MSDGMRVLARVILDETPLGSSAELPRVRSRSTRAVSPGISVSYESRIETSVCLTMSVMVSASKEGR